MIPESELKSWARPDGDHTFVCTTNPGRVDLEALNAALGSDLIWWAKACPEAELKTMVENSLCLSIYVEGRAQPEDESGAIPSQPMIAFARIITDYVTFGYLTDVYVLPEYQGKGLGRWMMQCLNEVVGAWQNLRRLVILTGSPDAVRLYENTLGARDIRQTGSNLVYMERLGAAGAKNKTA